MASPKAVYVVNINGKQYRRTVDNPYVLMDEIKKDIRTCFNLDYDFDLRYKTQEISVTSSLADNAFDDDTPLIVTRKDTKQISKRFVKEEYKRPRQFPSLSRQTPDATNIHKVLSFKNLLEEDTDDETESANKTLGALNEENYRTPTTMIINIYSTRSVDEEELSLTYRTSSNNPLLPRSTLPSVNEPVAQTTDEHLHAVQTPACSTEVRLAYPADLPMNGNSSGTARYQSRSPTEQQTTVQLSSQTNSPVAIRNTSFRETVMNRTGPGEIENLPNIGNNRLPNDSLNVTSGCTSSSSSRSSSPGFFNFNLIVPTANRDMPKGNQVSSQTTVVIQTLHDSYSLELPTGATLKHFHRIIKQQLQQHTTLEKYSSRTHTLLLFNSRMHIFKHIDINSECIGTFLALKTNHKTTSDHTPDFFVYALNRTLSEKMYVYEKDPSTIFDNSIWWQSHSHVEQTPLAQSTLLSTLYILYQYFRRPLVNEKASRRASEIQFLLYLRKYLFPPAFQAVKHLLIGEMFAFEKAVLIDGLLQLLSLLCPSSVERNLLGIYTPHLFCWFFQQSGDEMETQDGFLKFDLMRYSNSTIPHYINDPVTIHDLDHDRNILYEYHEAERYKHITRNIDIYSLIKYIQNPIHNETCDLDTYTVDIWGSHPIKSLDRWTEEQITKLEETMSRVYRSFTFLVRNVLENSDVRDQLILVNNKQVGICFKRRQRIKSDGKLDQDLQCFMPADASHSGIVTLNTCDVFEVEHGRPDPRIPTPLRSNLPMTSNPVISSSPTEQITLIVLDISDSMFQKRVDKNTTSKRFIDISINMLMMISRNLYRQSRSHAIGMILFGKDVITHCPITRNAEEFEKAVYRIPKCGQPWTSMYDAISTGLDRICQYASKHSVISNCEKLIICITDGINNRGSLTIDDLKHKIRRAPVVIDLIFFSPNKMTSYTSQERQSINAFRLLCERTGGIIYRNSSEEPIDLAITFEQEAVLWLKARKERKGFGGGTGTSVECPAAREPENLYKTAVRVQISQRIANDSHHGKDFFQRLHVEVNDVVRKQMQNMHLYIRTRKDGQMDYTFWKVILQGPHESLYAKGRWLIYVIFSDDYPVIPPTIRFHTPIFHLNITADGHISHHLLDICWSTVISMNEIFRIINKLLIKPDIRNGVSEEYVHFYERDRSGYESRVYKHCEQYASKTIDQLKSIYRLAET